MKFITLFLLIAVFSMNRIQAQDQGIDSSKTSILSIVESRNFVFNARTMLPTGGRSRQLTHGYTLRVAGDSVISDLPYFGRAYNIPIGQAGSGIIFTSAESEIVISDARKGGWDILIKPKDVTEIRQVRLQISETGQTSVSVISNSRQAISYWGDITKTRR